ncbi:MULTISPECIES: WYL domain-containing protein [unclassified Nostoc]|uniref:WYL domain-containing protein n=1 Tax=unclassified Nostoc TaxID=2593658 RepID=UPI000B95212E|nr:WYL domain-containing protein [Nostoc sp. 'Peltigera membranacea cyanobiont' 232]OYE03557.1 kinase [Nostoc sp. 'Peltigera membranacea cyanobiont' 232]
MICHFLIGIPGSGKTTFAVELAKLGNYRIVSTDAIRQKLYGNASIQGEWSHIEEKVISEIADAIAQGDSVIYDATNAKRVWRMDLLKELNSSVACLAEHREEVLWMGWHLQTPIATCKLWNQKRTRQVPDMIIENMHKSLQDFPPIAAEGFASVKEIDVTSSKFDIQQIPTQIQQLPRTLTNRANRNRHITLHGYSKLLDFERLMHLISLIIRYPGIGNLQTTNHTLLESILGNAPAFASSLEEVTAFMDKLCGTTYANKNAIEFDLHWLQQNSLIGVNSIAPSSGITVPPDHSITPSTFVTHPYSDCDSFWRLIQIIRLILHHPFLQDTGKGSLQTLVSALRENGIIDGDGLDTVRKDIEKVLKPYKILPEFPLRDGYFAGTAILSTHELTKVFDVLQSQAKSLDDPVALEIYEIFATRMVKSKLGVSNVYPVRAITNRSMIEPEFLPSDTLSKNLQQLEEAIIKGQLLELNRFPGGGKFALDEEGFFLAFPLQIVFCNQAWYLGFECEGGKYAGLFRFERLDRLFVGQFQGRFRSKQEQEKSLQKLQKLSAASAGIFLGYSASDQHKFLSNDKQEHSQACITVELWFNDAMFRFIAEGTKRFPARQMNMSPPVEGGRLMLPKSIFCLKKTTNKQFPNRFRVVLPIWYLGDVEFLRWIVGFGGNVKVVQPEELVAKVKGIGEAILKVYQQ